MNHDSLCEAGPYDNGWAPPCNGESCSYCWDREDNCKCQCALITEARSSERQRCIDLLVDDVDRIYGRLPSVDGALLEGLRWAVEYLHDTRGESVDESTH